MNGVLLQGKNIHKLDKRLPLRQIRRITISKRYGNVIIIINDESMILTTDMENKDYNC